MLISTEDSTTGLKVAISEDNTVLLNLAIYWRKYCLKVAVYCR